MTIPFVARNPTKIEVEQFRLILSTYQDGSGMLKRKDRTLPGWRDFERSVAAVFSGEAQESKWIYDVCIDDPNDSAIRFGLSCKMRGMLSEVERKQRVTIELSNASGEFWDAVKAENITQENHHERPDEVGKVLIETVERWHTDVSLGGGGMIDTSRSSFVVLQWDEKSGQYQLFQYPIDLPDPASLSWSVKGRRLIGSDSTGILFEWYGLSGGQLKYYPLVENASWNSQVFQLETLSENHDYGLVQKAKLYFPDLWNELK